jgi:chemotaxis signal transduction protein
MNPMNEPQSSVGRPDAGELLVDAGNGTSGFEKAEELRREFDASFAAPPASRAGETIDLLSIRVGNELLAMRVSELAGLDAHRKIVPLPARDGALLGIAGIGGRLVPVYSLALLLGQESPEEPLWLAIVGEEAPVGLAFGAFEGHLRVSHEALHVPAAELRRHVGGALKLASGVRYILDLKSIVIAIQERVGVTRRVMSRE